MGQRRLGQRWRGRDSRRALEQIFRWWHRHRHRWRAPCLLVHQQHFNRATHTLQMNLVLLLSIEALEVGDGGQVEVRSRLGSCLTLGQDHSVLSHPRCPSF